MKRIEPTLFGTEEARIPGGGYLESVILDRSLPRAWAKIALHFARNPGDVIVDLTYRNSGWDDAIPFGSRRVVRLDWDPGLRGIDARADWKAVPLRTGRARLCFWDAPWNFDGGKDGDARRRYTAPYRNVSEILADMRPAEWARVVAPGGYFVARSMNSFHGGHYCDLRESIASEMLARGPWERWGEVIVEVGGRVPNHDMRDDNPTIRTVHSHFQVFRRAKT